MRLQFDDRSRRGAIAGFGKDEIVKWIMVSFARPVKLLTCDKSDFGETPPPTTVLQAYSKNCVLAV